MNENAKPIYRINNGATGVAVFTSTYETDSGPKQTYNIVLRKGVKNKQTGQWDEYKITMFDEQALAVAEMLKMAYRAIIDAKQQPKTDQPAINSIDDDILF